MIISTSQPTTLFMEQMFMTSGLRSIVADMSSDIFKTPVDISKYDLIYAGAAQKTLLLLG